jgi:hypothetical protein
MGDEYIEGNRVARLKVLGLILTGMALFLFAKDFSDIIYPAPIETDPDKPCESLHALVAPNIGVFLMSFLVFGWLCIHNCRLAMRVKRSGRWPPPGMEVPFRTRIQYGKKAKISWIMLLVSGGMLLTHPAIMLYGLYITEKTITEVCTKFERADSLHENGMCLGE